MFRGPQLLLSLELYILGPYCRRQVAAASHAAHAALTAGMIGAAAALLARQSALATSAYCCALLFITFICPMWLVRIHKFKAAINGRFALGAGLWAGQGRRQHARLPPLREGPGAEACLPAMATAAVQPSAAQWACAHSLAHAPCSSQGPGTKLCRDYRPL